MVLWPTLKWTDVVFDFCIETFPCIHNVTDVDGKGRRECYGDEIYWTLVQNGEFAKASAEFQKHFNVYARVVG